MRAVTYRTGVLHELQQKQLRTWGLVILGDQATGLKMGWKPPEREAKVVEYKRVKTRLTKLHAEIDVPSKTKVVVLERGTVRYDVTTTAAELTQRAFEVFQSWIRWLLGPDWDLEVRWNGKLLGRGGRGGRKRRSTG